MKRVLLILCFLLSRLSPESADSQPADLQFEHLTTLNGLSQDIVTCLHQDRFGFLWIGTEDGLNRYDGYTVKVYKRVSNDTVTLCSNWILGLYDFGEEDLMITTQRGICIYRRATDTFTPPPGVLSGLPSDGYKHPTRDKDGNYWFIRNNCSIIKYSPDLTHYSTFDSRIVFDSSSVNTFYLDRHDRVVVGTESGLLILNENLSILKTVPNSEFTQPSSQHISVVSVTEDASGVFWLGTRSGLYNYNEKTNKLEFVSLSGDSSDPKDGRDLLFDLEWDHSNRLWIAGFGGLYCYNTILHRSFRYPSIQDQPRPGRASRIYAVYTDPADLLWVGTWGEGLAKINLHKEQFGLLRHTSRTPFAGGESSISAVYEDPDGTVWFGDQTNGVTLVNRSIDKFEHWNPGNLSGTSVTAITGDSAGNVWIASNYNTLDWYNIQSGTMRHIRLPSTREEHKTIFSMLADPSGLLWIGTEAHGVYRFDIRHKKFQKFGTGSADSIYSRIKSAWSFFSDQDKNIWIGGWVANSNLHRIDSQTGALQSYEQRELSSARSIIGDGEGGLWVGTWGNGLTKFSPASGELHNYTERDGIPSNYVKGILGDDHGNLWISTEKGLSKFNPMTKVFRNYDISDGLQSNFFYSGSCTKGRNGKLYFGGPNGVNAFYPDSIHGIEYVAPIVLTVFRIFDHQKFFNHSLSLMQEIELSHDDNLFAFEYVSLDYRAPARHQYAYMMEGFDNDWIQAGTRKYVSYTHLDPGKYVFKVKGTNSDGVWSSTPASIRIVITPAFWQTWWFRVAAALVLLSMLYGVYHYRINKLLEIERTRSTIATDLHDDIGTSLTNIALLSDLAQQDVVAGSAEVTHRLEKISTTSRTLLDAMNDIVWSIKPENDALEQIILRMEDYAVEMLEENGIDLHVEIPEQLKRMKLPMAVRRNLFLIFKEVIGNILKHSGATQVDVMISMAERNKRQHNLQMVIKDNGKGFNQITHNQGNGLYNMKTRAHHLGGTVTVSSTPGLGTNVEIRFPIKSPI